MTETVAYIRNSLKDIYPPGEAQALVRLIMERVCGLSTHQLLLGKGKELSDTEKFKIKEIVEGLRLYKPIQYLLGIADFYGMEFKVTPDVLIPRPETEELVEMVLKKIPDHPVRILDMGTGSGVIGVTLALELKERAGEVVLADISPQALDLALENAMRLGARVSTIQTNLFANIPQEKTDPHAEDADSAPEGGKGENGRNMLFDVIVANLPYIAEGEKLAPEVMKDPHTALFGGPKGWEIIERFLARARDYLNEDGFVALEIGYDQASVVTQIMDGYGYNYIEVLKDMSGVSRFPFGYR